MMKQTFRFILGTNGLGNDHLCIWDVRIGFLVVGVGFCLAQLHYILYTP